MRRSLVPGVGSGVMAAALSLVFLAPRLTPISRPPRSPWRGAEGGRRACLADRGPAAGGHHRRRRYTGGRRGAVMPLMPSLLLAVAGVALISFPALARGAAAGPWQDQLRGLLCAAGALGILGGFAVGNARCIRRVPHVIAHDWSLLLVVSGVEALVPVVPAFPWPGTVHPKMDLIPADQLRRRTRRLCDRKRLLELCQPSSAADHDRPACVVRDALRAAV